MIKILLFLFSTIAFSYDVPKFIPNVVDETGTLNPEAIERINRTIDSIHQTKKFYPAVYVTSRLAGESVEDVAEQVFRKWQLGMKGNDNGVLILVAIGDRKMRIEVGYGLEDSLTDYQAALIISQTLTPAFRDSRFEEGIVQSLQQMNQVVNGTPLVEAEAPSDPQDTANWEEIKKRAYIWLALFLGLPALIQSFGIILASLFKPMPWLEMRQKKEFNILSSMLGFGSGGGIYIKLFLAVNPGIFIVLFPVLMGDDLVIPFNIVGLVLISICALFALNFVLKLFSETRYRKSLARNRLNQFKSKKSPGSTYTMFGKSYTAPSRSSSSSSFSSSSSSSSSSRSSSSGGGRSGGGGASGSW